MAQQGPSLASEKLCCSICLELLKDPVTIPCGHSYCMSCIKTHWDGEDRKNIHSCPQCRQTFIPRPVLVKSTMLAELVEDLKKTDLQAAPAGLCYAGPEDVACDMCTGRRLKALKSCLRCMVSYCEEHLQPHYQVDQLKKHQLVEPSKKLQENICPQHEEVMKMFCCTDQKCICMLCTMDEHKGHNVVTVAAERKEKQRELELSRQNIQQKVQDREKDVELLQKEVKDLNLSTDKVVGNSFKLFSEMMRLMEERQRDLEKQVRSQQQTEVSRAKDLLEQLEQEITELKRRDAELEQLSHTQDHTQFLLSCSSLAPPRESADSSSISIRPLRHFEELTAAVSELRDGLQDLLRDKWTNITSTVAGVDVLVLPPEPSTREDFLRYSCELTLDPNTAHRRLLLSEENKRTTRTGQPQSYPDHPDRFTGLYQVLSRESLTGRSYWEVEWTGTGIVVAVAYKTISRAGNRKQCGFGLNDISWALLCHNSSYEFDHNNISTHVPGPLSSRIGVYLDHTAGVLSFYSVSGTMTLLHRVQTSFSQPLHAGFWHTDINGNTAKFSDLKQSLRV